MSRPAQFLRNTITEATYVELVQTLFRTLVPTFIIGVTFTGVAVFVSHGSSDSALILLAILGTVSVLTRVLILLYFREEAAVADLSVRRTHELERIFAAGYLLFAAIFGMFCARAFAVTPSETHELIIGMLVGYGAGVAAGIAYRPWISVTAIMLGVIPTTVVSFASADTMEQAVGLLLLVFLAGAIQSMLSRYRFAADGITMKHVFADLARSDVLTGLPNRVGLGERFNQATMLGRASGDLAVHCLDLDRFKPVNDSFGHPVGDLLLQAVSDRLTGTLRGSDFAARIGGDEFVVVHSGLKDSTEAELLAQRIVRVISEPYGIGDLTISIGTSVGFALLSDHGHSLEKLIAAADQALLEAKSSGGGCARSGGFLRLAA